MLRICLYIFFIFYSCNKTASTNTSNKSNTWYFSSSGNDNSDGSIEHPFKTIELLNSIPINPGDKIFFKGGETFPGNIVLDSTKDGTKDKPIVLSSYGNGNAIIDAANGTALTIYNSSYVSLKNLSCKGFGRKDGNTKAGILISDCANISVENIDVSGFQKSGLQLYNCKNVMVDNLYAHDNGAAGIGVEGIYNNKLGSMNIHITRCTAVNNPGDPTNLTNHSGNGIVVGHCTNVVIDHCMATNNGWDMPRIGNGPVGIWCYEADSVVIQHCLSYQNKTSVGGADGGGFDLDGGVTNSVIQYCLSYDNQGSGYCMFQYWGASPWYNNVIRFNISENDGLVSDSRAGIYVWNSSDDDKQFYGCDFYNNTVYNSKEAAISFSSTSQRKNFRFFNNIFIAKDSLLRGIEGDDTFLANDWWSIEKKFNADGFTDFKSWALHNNKEQLNGKIIGLNELPYFKNADNTTLTNVNLLSSFDKYTVNDVSLVTQSGIDLQALFNINTGTEDFNGNVINKNYIGACTHQ